MKRFLFLVLPFIPFLTAAQYSNPTFMMESFDISLEGVETGDLDNDGQTDLVFSFIEGISWSKNIDDNGKWSTNQHIDNYESYERSIKLANLDGDDFLDIVVIQEGSGESFLIWYKNNGNGSFSSPIQIDLVDDNLFGSRRLSLDISDMDNDGDIDIVAAYAMADEELDVVKWYENINASGVFTPHIISTSVNQPWHVQLVQANSDNLKDIILSAEGDSLLLFTGNGQNNYLQQTVAYPGLKINSLTTGDFDGDGDKDIIGGQWTGKIILYENLNNQGIFSNEITLLEEGGGPYLVFVKDIDRDSDLDILFTGPNSGKVAYIKNQDGMGNFSTPIEIANDITGGPQNGFAFFDMDSDQDLDLIATGNYWNQFRIYENMDGDFIFDQSLNMAPSAENRSVKIGDIDGDNYLDMIVTDANEPFYLSWLRYNVELNLYEKPIALPFDESFGYEVDELLIFDTNNDGTNDIIYRKYENDYLIVLSNSEGGNFTPSDTLEVVPDLFLFETYHADMNNDGFQDIVVANGTYTETSLYWYENLGLNSGFAPYQLFHSGNRIVSLGIIDVDEDNFLDLTLVFKNSDNSYEIGWIKNDNGILQSWESLIETSYELSEILIHDANDDGIKDLFVTRVSGFVGIQYFEASAPYTFPAFPEMITQGSRISNMTLLDYDLDGLKDLVFIEDRGEFYWQKNTGECDGLFAPKEMINLVDDYAGLFIQDFEGDGDKDFFFQTTNGFYFTKNIAEPTTAKEWTEQSDFVVFPNPTNGIITIDFEERLEESILIQINDLSGRTVSNREIPSGISWVKYDENELSLSNGIYFIHIKMGELEFIKKLIVIH